MVAPSPDLTEALLAGIVGMVRAAASDLDAAVRPVASYATRRAFRASGVRIVLALASGIAKNNLRVQSVAVPMPYAPRGGRKLP